MMRLIRKVMVSWLALVSNHQMIDKMRIYKSSLGSEAITQHMWLHIPIKDQPFDHADIANHHLKVTVLRCFKRPVKVIRFRV